jgi:nicotinamidase-related amidase
MRALVIVDAQNEFGPGGNRTVPRYASALEVIHHRIEEARRDGSPIAFIRHHNVGAEVTAFAPGTWGAQFSEGVGPLEGQPHEVEIVKEVIGAFTDTGLHEWLREHDCDSVLLVGFFAHVCISTSAREAYVRGYAVSIDPDGTDARPISHEILGEQTADEVKRTALLHLAALGVAIEPRLANSDVPASEAPVLSR